MKHHDAVFGGCSKTIVDLAKWVPDLSRRNAHGLQGKNVTRDGGGIRRTMAAIVKATSNVEDGHSFGLNDERAAGVEESWGCGEDGVRGIFMSDHVGAGNFHGLLCNILLKLVARIL